MGNRVAATREAMDGPFDWLTRVAHSTITQLFSDKSHNFLSMDLGSFNGLDWLVRLVYHALRWLYKYIYSSSSLILNGECGNGDDRKHGS